MRTGTRALCATERIAKVKQAEFVEGFRNLMDGAFRAFNDRRAIEREEDKRIPALFLIGFVILYVKVFGRFTTLFSIPDSIDKLMLIVGSVLLLFHCYKNIDRYKGLVAPLFLALAFGVHLYFATDLTDPFVFILVAISAPTAADSRSLIRMWLWITVPLTLLLCVIYVIVLLVDPSSINFVYRGGEVRHAFGFIHPNTAATVWLMIICAYLYLKSGKINGATIVGVLLLAIIVFVFTDSRTSFILSCLAPLLCYCQQKWGFLGSKAVKWALYLLPLLLFLLVFLLSSVLYSNDIAGWFSTRVWLWHVCYENQGITLLGQRFEEVEALTIWGYVDVVTTLDSFYARGLFTLGLVFCLVFCLLYWSTLSSIKNRFSLRYCVLVLVLAYGFTEATILNIFLLAPGLFLINLGIESRLATAPSVVEAGRTERNDGLASCDHSSRLDSKVSAQAPTPAVVPDCDLADTASKKEGQCGGVIKYAPIVIPTLCRFEHLKKAVDSLSRNGWARFTTVYIVVDYPTQPSQEEGHKAILKYLRQFDSSCFRELVVIERESNYGPGKNAGALINSAQFSQYDRWITAEDDIEFAPNFIEYMDKCLSEYELDDSVYAVCGYSYPVSWRRSSDSTLFLSDATCSAWGIGVWRAKRDKARDEICNQQYLLRSADRAFRDGLVDNMIPGRRCEYVAYVTLGMGDSAMCKMTDVALGPYLALSGKKVVIPYVTKTRNNGFDNTGLNCPAITNAQNKHSLDYDYSAQPLDQLPSFDLKQESNLEFISDNKELLGKFLYVPAKKRLVSKVGETIYWLFGKTGCRAASLCFRGARCLYRLTKKR